MDKATMGMTEAKALRTTYTYHGVNGGIYRLKAGDIIHDHIRDGGTLPLAVKADAAMVGEPDMLTIVADSTAAAAMLGRKGGAAKGGAKAKASRANGAKGGRPAILFDDGEFSIVKIGNDGSLARVISRVFGKETGRWLLGSDDVERIKAAKDSDEIAAILEE